jgi:release factor glutamine methyltransferase
MSLAISTLLTKARQKLFNSSSPRLDAEILLGHILGVTRSYLLTWPEKVLTANQLAQFESLLKKRVQGQPIAYLIHQKEFWSLDLQITENTLIPRPETELLVEQVLARLSSLSNAQVIDLGTGSGAIALAIAKERPNCRILATDQSAACLAIAQNNAQQLRLTQVEFLCSDWWVKLKNRKALIIVSNPPYIAEDDPHLSQGDVLYEPRSALVAGPDGLSAIRQLIVQSHSHLVDGGWLLLEHGYNQAPNVQQLFQNNGYQRVETYYDLAGLPRVTVGQK